MVILFVSRKLAQINPQNLAEFLRTSAGKSA
jgi:hypothetical protein